MRTAAMVTYYKPLSVFYLLVTLVCVVGMFFVESTENLVTLSAIAAASLASFLCLVESGNES